MNHPQHWANHDVDVFEKCGSILMAAAAKPLSSDASNVKQTAIHCYEYRELCFCSTAATLLLAASHTAQNLLHVGVVQGHRIIGLRL